MNKIWILKSKYSWKLCKTEEDLLRRITKSSSLEVLEFELKSSSKANDYLLSKERDIQLKSVLGELTQFEIDAQNLISLYEELAPDGKEVWYWNSSFTEKLKSTEKLSWVGRLRKWQDNKSQFKKILVDHKHYFLELSSDLRWMVALLKCHNFAGYTKLSWNKDTKSHDDVTDPKLLELMKLAKSFLKKKG